MPRWRRPSLLQARKADPLRTEATAPRLAFDQGFNGALAGTERRLIRYTVVRLLDAPDELRGREIGVLGEGDEVELLEKQGVYWLVGCPDGGRGWIHKMTLGAVVGAAGARTTRRPPRSRSPPTPGRWASPTSTTTSWPPTSSRGSAPAEAAPAPGAARGCAGGRCSGRTRADSRTAAAASRPGTR